MAAVAGVGALSLGGISLGGFSLGSHETLSNPTVTHNGVQTFLTYSSGGSKLTTFGLAPSSARVRTSTHQSSIKVVVSMTQPQNTKMTSLTLKMRAPPAGSTPAPVSLINTMGNNPNPPIKFYMDNLYSVLEIDHLRGLGEGTVGFEFELLYVHDSTKEIYVDFEYHLTEPKFLGKTFTVKGQTTAPLPTRKVN